MIREGPFRLMPSTFGHCPFGGGGGHNACPDGLGHLLFSEAYIPCRMVKNGPKKSALECPVEWRGEGGSNRYLGNAQM